MLKKLSKVLLSRNEKRLGASLDYAHKIAESDTGLFLRYAKIFGFLDPRKHLPADAYHTARLCGALTADCGTCVEIEINLAREAGLETALIRDLIANNYEALTPELKAVAELASMVTRHQDAPEAREVVSSFYGLNGLIEASYAMNGAALLPSIKRAMGYATGCDIEVMRNLMALDTNEHNKAD